MFLSDSGIANQTIQAKGAKPFPHSVGPQMPARTPGELDSESQFNGKIAARFAAIARPILRLVWSDRSVCIDNTGQRAAKQRDSSRGNTCCVNRGNIGALPCSEKSQD